MTKRFGNSRQNLSGIRPNKSYMLELYVNVAAQKVRVSSKETAAFALNCQPCRREKNHALSIVVVRLKDKPCYFENSSIWGIFQFHISRSIFSLTVRLLRILEVYRYG